MAPLPSSFSIKNGPNSCPASMGNLMVRRDKMPARYARELGLGVIVIGSTNSSTWVNLDTLIGKCLF